MTAPEEAQPTDSPTGWVNKHIREYVESDGRKGHRWNGLDTLLITTVGRKSGLPRRTALIYGRDGDHFVIVASYGGKPEHPFWYRNLTEHPEVEVQVGADKFTARARTASKDEKTRLWPTMVGIFPTYESYQKKTPRDIPVVILERVTG